MLLWNSQNSFTMKFENGFFAIAVVADNKITMAVTDEAGKLFEFNSLIRSDQPAKIVYEMSADEFVEALERIRTL